MTVWRITHSRHLEDAFSGFGAETYGGRFNSKGRKLVYAAGSISLAMLELLVQANQRSRLIHHVCIPATLHPSRIEVVEADQLPLDWDARPYANASHRFGDRWLDETRSLVLSVPSVVNPHERNYLINPMHPQFDEVEIGEALPALFDPRLLKKA